MHLYLAGRAAPGWDALLENLLRHWSDLYEEASYHIVGVKTWRDLHARLKATREEIERWRSGGTVSVAAKIAHQPQTPTASPAPKADAPPDWIAYVENLKAKERHYWLAMVQDLARDGLPCDDCIDRAARELGRFLVHVQGVEPIEAAGLVFRWAEAKSNGYITRLRDGKASDVRRQISRIVSHVADEQDFGGKLSRMREKLASGRYRKPIDLPALMMGPADRTSTPSSPPGREEERVILVDKNLSGEEGRAIWEGIRQQVIPFLPRQVRRREGWWLIVRNVVSYLQDQGGEAPISKSDQAGLRGSPPTVKAILDALVAAGVLAKGRRRYAQATVYTLLDPAVTTTRPGT